MNAFASLLLAEIPSERYGGGNDEYNGVDLTLFSIIMIVLSNNALSLASKPVSATSNVDV